MGDMTFESRVLAWLQTRDADAAKVIKVVGCGNDWAGSTEDGFNSTFDVDITYAKKDGRRQTLTPEGSEMASLWDAVVGETGGWYAE